MTDEQPIVVDLKDGKPASTAPHHDRPCATTIPLQKEDIKPREEPLDFDDYLDMMWFDIWRVL